MVGKLEIPNELSDVHSDRDRHGQRRVAKNSRRRKEEREKNELLIDIIYEADESI